MNVKKITITPEMASAMLKNNIGNRPVNKKHVSWLAREMQLGRWKLNGDTICVNGERLIDGQHRLMAVIESGCTIETLLVDGLPSDVFDTKDVGRKRSASDTLAVRGEVETKKLASALVAVDRYMTGRATTRSVRYTNTDVEILLAKYPDVRHSIKKTRVTKRLVPDSILTACHYLFSRKSPEEADAFVKDLISGLGLEEGDSIYPLRERLMNNALSKAKLPPYYIMALLIKAWNARRSGKKNPLLKFRQEGERPEEFPIVK